MSAVGAPPPVERLLDGDGNETGRLVHSEDGTLLLETARLAVFDLAAGDEGAPEPRKTGWTLFAVMFGATAPRASRTTAADPLAPLRAWITEDAGRGARLYRTVGGHRILLTAPPLDPASGECDRLLDRLGADAATRNAGRERACFRVRLSPPAAPEREAGIATCRFVEALGRDAEGAAAQLVELHDFTTRAHDRLPLA
jgi:hypothetical protein